MVRWHVGALAANETREYNLDPENPVNPGYGDAEAANPEYAYAPAQLLGFVLLDGELMCIGKTCNFEHVKSSVFSTEWTLETDGDQPVYRLFEPDCIVRHCLMIPRNLGVSNSYHEIWERERWADEFY